MLAHLLKSPNDGLRIVAHRHATNLSRMRRQSIDDKSPIGNALRGRQLYRRRNNVASISQSDIHHL
jgi:hypothetical protein